METLTHLSPAAAAAKSLQSCPTLCDPRDGSPPGSSTHGIFQARVLDSGAIAFSAFISNTRQKLVICQQGKTSAKLVFFFSNHFLLSFSPAAQLNFSHEGEPLSWKCTSHSSHKIHIHTPIFFKNYSTTWEFFSLHDNQKPTKILPGNGLNYLFEVL